MYIIYHYQGNGYNFQPPTVLLDFICLWGPKQRIEMPRGDDESAQERYYDITTSV